MRLRHFAIPAAVLLAALTGLATPAQADDEGDVAYLGVFAPEQVTVIEGHTKSVTVTVGNYGNLTAKSVVLKFTKVDASVGLVLPAGCDATTGCAVGDLKSGELRKYKFSLTPDAATSADLTSSLTLAVSGEKGAVGSDTQVAVVRSKGGVDLEVADVDDMKLDRGQSADIPVTVRNAGTESVDAIGVILMAEAGLETLTRYSNCETQSEEGINAVVCVFEQDFAAGAEFTVPDATPLQIKVADDAGGPYTYTAAVGAVGVNRSVRDSLAAKSGPKLKLKSLEDDWTAPDDLNEDDNTVDFGVAVGKSAADSAAVGGTFTGAVGDTSTVKVGVHNLGPTGTIPPSLSWFQTVLVTLPAGVEITKTDEYCLPSEYFDESLVADSDYLCLVLNRIGKNESAVFSFTGEITEGDHDAGKVVVDGGVQDSNAKNDSAALTVELTEGGEGGGGTLPITGAPAAWLAAGGALLLIIGGALFAATRRRRIITKA